MLLADPTAAVGMLSIEFGTICIRETLAIVGTFKIVWAKRLELLADAIAAIWKTRTAVFVGASRRGVRGRAAGIAAKPSFARC